MCVVSVQKACPAAAAAVAGPMAHLLALRLRYLPDLYSQTTSPDMSQLSRLDRQCSMCQGKQPQNTATSLACVLAAACHEHCGGAAVVVCGDGQSSLMHSIPLGLLRMSAC